MDDVNLFDLKIKDFKKGIMEEFDICYIEGNRQKTKMYYQAFLNSEAVSTIELYLKERKHKSSEDWLFANIRDDSKECSFNTFSESLKIVCRKLDIKNITPKSLRRIFNDNLKKGKVDFEIRKRLMGHKVEISEGSAYDLTLNDEYEFAKEFSDNIEHLTLLGNGNKKISNVEKQIEELKIRNKGLEGTINDLKDDISKIYKLLKNSTDLLLKDSTFKLSFGA